MYKFDKADAYRFAKEQGINTKVIGNELRFNKCPYCKNKTNDKHRNVQLHEIQLWCSWEYDHTAQGLWFFAWKICR